MPSMMTTIDGFPVPVSVTGPEKGVVVVILGAEQRAPAAYDALCERLHTASLRTVVIGAEPRLTPKSVVGILDALVIGWAVVVGDRTGGELAWELAATRLGRFVGLVAIDRGHPRVPDLDGVIRDEDCPPVEINTTVLASSPAARAVARDSQRFVYAEYRVADLLARHSAQESTAQLAAEIVLRTSTW
jgi:pimeloyl-ACP methyl ester carboxylesterase